MFMPMFIQTTDRLLSDPELLKSHQMDIQVVDNTMNGEGDNNQQDEEIKQSTPVQQDDEHKLIQMVTTITLTNVDIGYRSGCL